ncbi:50S ribosomal protein L32 [Prosthecochloris sp. GSB1]|uniref:50S ribosomal protein L32 n=1 Tax=Prosthecochloris sp. GSB1 TaxID=281093 RepID=UPI000B8D000B|nr:50S ribosomal protein L32 [Prosthecochloris sp. GSB1]ASQ89666.1 50S ribosomal protein L32 [Prosthecochloris sp. GSB1]
MATPKSKVSKSRRDKRRAQFTARSKAAVTVVCPNCGEPTLPHRACRHCGHYKGRNVLTKTSKS